MEAEVRDVVEEVSVLFRRDGSKLNEFARRMLSLQTGDRLYSKAPTRWSIMQSCVSGSRNCRKRVK